MPRNRHASPAGEVRSSDYEDGFARLPLVDLRNSASRSLHPGALDQQSLVPGLWIVKHYSHLPPAPDERALVLSTPRKGRFGCLSVALLEGADDFTDDEIRKRRYPRDRVREAALTDAGMIPYGDGTWNSVNYWTRSETQHSLKTAATAS